MNYKTKSILSLLLTAVVTAALVFVSVAGIGPDKKFSAANIKRGLDLEGGLSITYQTVKEDPTMEEMSDTRYKLQLRVDNYSTEAAVYQEGTNRINVDIPGVSDAEKILKELGQAGAIYFIYGTGNVEYDYEKAGFVLTKSMEEIQTAGDVVLTGADIAKATARQIEAQSGVGYEYVVELNLNEEGRVKFADATRASIGKIIAIVYDGEVISAPKVNDAITEGSAIISGMADFDEANKLASTIRIGALPLELTEIRSTVVGAQLGEEAISTSLQAAGIGFLCVILFMIVCYRIPGLAASIALTIYIGLNVIVLNLFDVTLTLQGMAGIILSVGMAVDANVIIFQRIREELATGKTVRSSMRLGFGKALSAIVDGNVTTLIAAFVLYFLGSGGVKGFAITLAIGILLSMFTALTVTRFILNALYGIGFDHEKFYGIQKERKILPFVKNFKKFVAVSAVIIVAGFVAMGVSVAKGNGALNYGLDFKGGTSLSVTFPEELTEKLNQRLEDTVSETLSLTGEIVKVTGENTYIIKTVELSQEQRAVLTDALVEEYGVDDSLIQTENISGKVSGEMRAAAVKAVIIATICMLIYIWIRFKNFNFAASAVSALLHDVLVVLTVYAVGRIGVGNTFIACMLTIVGYSINATIVIFDRIRENLAQNAENEETAELSEIVNKSVTETLSRSINSSLTTFIMIFMLALLGVDTIREFAFPLMAGIIAGAWSSVCITGGFWHVLERKFKRNKPVEEGEWYEP
ncbi:MAG: protein translocase subunit SecD [Lachnospiraceae bacterium]|nr:protein translocase subunit SecD [Lachnospiraceae bacterium]